MLQKLRFTFSVVPIIISFVFLTCPGLSSGDQNLNPAPYSSANSGAYAYRIPDETLIGIEQTYTVKAEESFHEIARLFGLGFNELVEANPDIDPWSPQEGSEIKIPSAWILPQAKDDGIVINLAELRLYYFFNAGGLKMVKTFPIGIGQEGLSTPTGVFRIIDKIQDPNWYPSPTARSEDPSLPPVVPPGPENPLGGYWLQLSAPGYGIHGTNKPWGIGRKVSRGCIRLYPEGIPWLFEVAKRGTRVEIVDQPVKIGTRDNRLFIQVHPNGLRPEELHLEALTLFKKARPSDQPDPSALQRAILESRGLAALISG